MKVSIDKHNTVVCISFGIILSAGFQVPNVIQKCVQSIKREANQK